MLADSWLVSGGGLYSADGQSGLGDGSRNDELRAGGQAAHHNAKLCACINGSNPCDHRIAVFSSAEGIGFERRAFHDMITADPPEHSRLRRLVDRQFLPRAVAQLELALLMRAILTRVRRLLPDGDVVRIRNSIARGVHRLPVVVEPR